jgi:hypothetical protein
VSGRPRPDLRGELRALGAIQADVLIGSRTRRWGLTLAALAIVGLTVAASAVAGLPFALGMALALIAALVGVLWLGLATTPARDRPLAGAFLLAGRRELSRFRGATGRRLPPRTRWAMSRWLRRVPESPPERPFRATYLVTLGRYADAAATVDRMEPAGAFERFERERLRAVVDFELGGPGDLGPTRRAFGAIEDPAERTVAAWQLAVEDACQRYVLGGDWREPLALAAGSGDPRARGVRAWLPTLVWGVAPIVVAIYLLALVVELVATGSVL